MNKDFKTIDDIFNDPDFVKITETSKLKKMHQEQDQDIKELMEIEDWIEEQNNGRLPQETKNITERKYYHRLIRMKNNPQKLEKLKKYDRLGLFSDKDYLNKNFKILEDEVNLKKTFNSLDEILNDDSILFSNDEEQDDSKLFDTKKYKRIQQNKAKNIAKRKNIKNFEEYSKMFKKVQNDLSYGRRKLRKFKNYDIETGRFYVLKGQLLYIESENDSVTKNDKNGIYEDCRVHVVYENGTESNIWKRGLGASLYGRNGKIVTEIENEEKLKLKSDDIVTGYIYVLKTLSQDPQLSTINPLFKVGVTTRKVEERIRNAENESTYLYAPVKLIEKIKIFNLEPTPLETAIHHALRPYQLNIDITLPNGNKIHPEEWFCVELKKIEDIIKEIFDSLRN